MGIRRLFRLFPPDFVAEFGDELSDALRTNRQPEGRRRADDRRFNTVRLLESRVVGSERGEILETPEGRERNLQP